MIRQSINLSWHIVPRPCGVSKVLRSFRQFSLSCAYDRRRRRSQLRLPKYGPVLVDRDCRSSYQIRASSYQPNLPTSDIQTAWLKGVLRYADNGPPDKVGSRAGSTLLDLIHTDVDFVCVDVEASELDSKVILEVGVATLNTKRLMNMPSEYGDLWNKKIRSHHMIVEEKAHLVNSKYVEGRPEEFQFGTTQRFQYLDVVASLKLMLNRHDESQKRQAMKEMFASLECRPETFPSASLSKAQILIDLQGLLNTYSAIRRRKVVLVGHALSNDKKYIKQLGINLDENPYIVAEIDTQRLVSTGGYLCSLKRLLEELKIPQKCLHNSGNDATYTLRALLALSLLPPADYRLLVERLAVKSANEQAYDVEMVGNAKQARLDDARITESARKAKPARIDKARIRMAKFDTATIEKARIQTAEIEKARFEKAVDAQKPVVPHYIPHYIPNLIQFLDDHRHAVLSKAQLNVNFDPVPSPVNATSFRDIREEYQGEHSVQQENSISHKEGVESTDLPRA